MNILNGQGWIFNFTLDTRHFENNFELNEKDEILLNCANTD